LDSSEMGAVIWLPVPLTVIVADALPVLFRTNWPPPP
jgi:hypothetical protein